MSSEKGTLTIEAAIVLPIFITIVLAVLYFIKGFYIQNEIESAMIKVAHEMAVHAYVVDQTGMVSIQQNTYNNSSGDYEAVTAAINSVIAEGQSILALDSRMTRDINVPWKDVEALPKVGDNDSLKDMLKITGETIKRAPMLFDTIYGNMLGFQKSIFELYEVAMTSMNGVAKAEMIEYANGKVAETLCRLNFKKYISDEQLVAWGVSYDNRQIDFSDSSAMLGDDTIQIVSKYVINFPLLPHIFKGAPIYQSVRVRAFTGSYDSEEKRNILEEKNDEEKVYFIATETPENYCYHYYSCLVKELKVATYGETVSKGRGLCIYCMTHYMKTKDIGELESLLVYFTSSTSKIHLNDTCPRIKAIAVEAVSVEEARERGYGKPCEKHGCVAKTEGIKQ